MATIDQLSAALVKADAAGDADAARAFAGEIRRMQSQKTEPSSATMAQDVAQQSKNALGGFIRGAGSIGATFARPFESAAENEDRRNRIDTNMADLVGADPNSLLYKGFKLGGEVSGTAGLGGLLANGTRMGMAVAGKAVPSALNTALTSIASGGFSTGSKVAPGVLPFLQNQGVRSLGGAVSGGAAAGLVNPEDAKSGALIGAAMPGAVKIAGEAGKLTKQALSGVAKNTLGMTTGAGAETFGTAYRAGKEGGTSFLDNMRGSVPMTDVLDRAKDALSKMRVDRGNQYRSGMVDIANDKSVIDFKPIDSAISSLQQMGSFKGQVINKNAAGTVDEISGLVNQWKGLDPAEFHTPEGLDALKKALGDVRDATQFGTPGRKAADTAYNAVKSQIDSQAPVYSKVMKDYSEASTSLNEIERSLSLGNKAAADTSMRKLQSLMRNNVNANYGNRLELAKTLESNGADILPSVAGQAASSWTPRGLQGLAATGAGFSSLFNPSVLAALPLTSPRLMGELTYGVGAGGRGISNAGNAASNKLARLLDQGNMSIPRVSQGTINSFKSTAPVIGAMQFN